MTDIESQLQQLGDEWGYVVVTHRPQYDDSFRWMVANHTDEGLGPGENVEARGETLTEAVENALAGDYYR